MQGVRPTAKEGGCTEDMHLLLTSVDKRPWP